MVSKSAAKTARASQALDRRSAVPLHEQLREALIREMAAFAPDRRLPTEFEIAERFALSRLTVHKVMAGLHRDGYVIRQPGRGTFVAPRDKQVHTPTVIGRNGSVIVAYADWFSYDIWGKVEAAERLALQQDVQLLNCKITREAMYGAVEALARDLDDLRGILVVPPGGALEAENLAMLSGLGVPVCLLTIVDTESLPANVFAVCQDFRQMGYLGIASLVALGHARFGYVAAEPWFLGCRQEYQGMKEALYANGLKLRDLHTPESTTKSWDDSFRRAYDLTAQMLVEAAPTGLIYDSVPTALAGVRAVCDLGLSHRMPDIVVNATYFGMEAYMWPPVTVVQTELAELVRVGMDRLLHPDPQAPRQQVVPVTVRAMPRRVGDLSRAVHP